MATTYPNKTHWTQSNGCSSSPPLFSLSSFRGGEPLLAFERIQLIIERIVERNEAEQRDIRFVITSTLHHLTEEILAFALKHCIQFSISLEGPAELHNANRPTPTRDSYERTLAGIQRVRATLGHDAVSALTTLTAKSLEQPRAIIDEYVKQGFSSVSLRPLTHGALFHGNTPKRKGSTSRR